MPLLNRIKTFARAKLNVEGDREFLQNQINYLAALAHLSVPEHFEPEDLLIKQINASLDLPLSREVKFAIHKNDVMFRHHLFHHAAEPDVAFKSYYDVGIDIARKCRKIAGDKGFRGKQILDFGSGYGRASRFYPLVFPEAEISVSEVKSTAMDFQKQMFGFGTIAHDPDASRFPDDRQFDLIIASSVFTHLPKAQFEKWLAKLYQCLSPSGLIIFSFNNIDRIRKPIDPDFHYTSHSEDSAFIVSDRLGNAEEYGLTFVSRNFLERQAKTLAGNMIFDPSMKIGKQELASLRKS